MDNVIMLEVNYDSDNRTEGKEVLHEDKTKMVGSLKGEERLSDRVEKIGGWFRLNTQSSDDNTTANDSDDIPFEVFCCNLTSSDKNETRQTMLLHVDYWKRQASKMKSQSKI